ncbi:DUF3169 family protein [Virgibacillus sp. NKC19-3]|uniref:DUF3169 domain-containing protein n=1 Tax=Virgibacillus saliphilus TaxID=2831674 RepID=UPI001C9A6483|nr:DUF3169 domain-containing protein [Virgibacillus sp. NKC19-3]MBY7144899.1 DUF3169 family protein [Virgibacillus sp. NKC19-3]
MNLIVRFIAAGFVGFVSYYVLMNFSELHYAGEIAVISLMAISIILIVRSIFRFRKVKSLNSQHFTGDEEDEVENKKYKLFSDYALCANVSFVLSILALSLSLLATQNVIMTVGSIIVLLITIVLNRYMTHIMQHVYSDRNMAPTASHADYPESVLDIADNGEKHVILDGLFQSQGLLNVTLILAIVLSTVYSINSDNAEIFSIILMAVVLLVVNVKYQLVIRNR